MKEEEEVLLSNVESASTSLITILLTVLRIQQNLQRDWRNSQMSMTRMEWKARYDAEMCKPWRHGCDTFVMTFSYV